MTMRYEFRVILDGDKAVIKHLDGSDVSELESASVLEMLIDMYGSKLFLYVAEGKTYDRWGQHKIGVTSNPSRREGELKTYEGHLVLVPEKRVWKFEHRLHQFFDDWRVDGEWFRFDDELGKQYLEKLLSLKSEADIKKLLYIGALWNPPTKLLRWSDESWPRGTIMRPDRSGIEPKE